jgi:heterodisulfide reductase subunit A
MASIRHKARFVDLEKCTGCGDCAAVCPETRPHDYEGQMAPVKAIYHPPGLRSVPGTWLIDMEYCTRCGACVDACPTGAIDLEMQDRTARLTVGAVLLTPGFLPFDARVKGEYGYQVYDNVLSALEFERMVSVAGSTVGQLGRPSDGQAPKRIAFVHCVGSRDNLCGAGHCSSACCMYTAKQVALAKQLDPELEVTVFFMDIRAFGKDFEAYMDGVQALPGVTYRRAMPSSVHQRQQTRDLAVTYIDETGRLSEEDFDLLVLAVGFAPPQGMQDLAQELGVALNAYGFAETDSYQPTDSTRPGVFVAGAFREPKDIPDTVAEAAAAASRIAATLTTGSGSTYRKADDLQPTTAVRDVSDEEPSVGVFVCQCNGEMAAIDVPQVVDWVDTSLNVALVRSVQDACSPEGRAEMVGNIQAAGLNRVVLAGCSQRLFTDDFDELMREAELDPRLMTRVNLLDQVIHPHSNNGADLTAKARSLVGMAVEELRVMTGVEQLVPATVRPPSRRALVIGGGAAGMTAALSLARSDVVVNLVERNTELGGQWRHIHHQPDGSDPRLALEDLVEQVEADQGINIHLASEVRNLTGTPGHYQAVVTTDEAETVLDSGVILVATGGQPAPTNEYLYGQDPRVLTQRELEQQIADGTLATVQTVVMIQCVGSREPQRPYCSRVCCTQAIKNALKLKELHPDLQVYVLYRDVRTYGFREAYYQAARDAGVVFLRYDLPDRPQVEAKDERLQLSVADPVTHQWLTLDADLLVLSVGIDGGASSTLARTLGVGLNADGFFQEEHAKMKPLDLTKGGIFVAGLAHSARFLDETIAQAQGAAMRASAFLEPGTGNERPTSVWVNPRLCSFCGMCVDACPYGARTMNYDTRVADVDYALCHGCGVCAVVCPNKATLQKTMEHKQLMAAIDMALV